MLTGGAGAETFTGGAGADTFAAGAGGADRFVFVAGDSVSTAGSLDVISGFNATADDILSVGITVTSSNFLAGSNAGSYAQALLDATSLISGGSRDVVVIAVVGSSGGLEDGTYVFADSGGANTLSNAIKLTGLTGVLEVTDFG
nr:hypothetical protein JKL49_07320 [Phenylobacterium glaciei]